MFPNGSCTVTCPLDLINLYTWYCKLYQQLLDQGLKAVIHPNKMLKFDKLIAGFMGYTLRGKGKFASHSSNFSTVKLLRYTVILNLMTRSTDTSIHTYLPESWMLED